MEFKIGDKVKVLKPDCQQTGLIGEVTDLSKEGMVGLKMNETDVGKKYFRVRNVEKI